MSSINESDTWYNKGLALYKLEKYEKAIKCCDEAIRINPRNADAWYLKSIDFAKLEKYEKAIKCCDEAIRINPKDDEYKILSQYLNRG